MKTLIVVDMQNDFVTGSLGTQEAKNIVQNVRKKIDSCLAADGEVIFTRDTHFDNYLSTSEGKHLPVPHCIKGTDGWNVVPEIDVPQCEHINKETFGCWEWAWKEEPEEIELVGVCTDICVVSNALILKALFPEIEITVDASCCAGVTPESHNAALQVMKSCQINVIGE